MNTYIFIGLITFHPFADNSTLNNHNELIGFSYNRNFVATMDNSFGNRSFIAGHELSLFEYEGIEVSTTIFGVTGYKPNYNTYDNEVYYRLPEELFLFNDKIMVGSSLNISYNNIQVTTSISAVNIGIKIPFNFGE